VVGSPLHGVVDFSECNLLRRLVGFLVNFSFRLEEYGAIFCAVVVLATVEHAAQRFEYVWASVVTAAMIWWSASLIVLSKSLIGGSRISFLWWWPKHSSPNSLVDCSHLI
jgi:hypothetical protein